MTRVSVILPSYNERGNIIPLASEVLEVLDANKLDGEVVMVDDGSPDGTGELARLFAEEKKRVRVFVNRRRLGLAASILRGIQVSSGDVVVVMDSDGSHPPSVIPQLVSGLQSADLCLASRYIQGGGMDAPAYKQGLSRLLNAALNGILGLGVSDSTGGFFAAGRRLLSAQDADEVFVGYGDYFFRLLYALKRDGKTFSEVPFNYELRRSGKTKTNVFIMGAKYLLSALKLRITGR
jgi:dolichol-phosphate mannosyltransferase